MAWFRTKKDDGPNRASLMQAYKLSNLLQQVLDQACAELKLPEESKGILKNALATAKNLSRYLDQAVSDEQAPDWFVGEALQLRGQLARLTTRIAADDKRISNATLPVSNLSGARDLAVIRQDLRSIGIDDNEHSRYFIAIAHQVLEEIESITKFGAQSYTRSRIVRTINPKPEHKQVVLSVLNYFGRIIEQKHGASDVRVTTQQATEGITFTVEVNHGDKGAVEDDLFHYGLVVMDQQTAETLLPVPAQALELRHKLDIAKLELRHTTELLYTERHGYSSKIEHLESEVEWLRKAIGEGLSNNKELQAAIIKIAQGSSQSIQDSLLVVLRKASNGLVEEDKARVTAELTKIANTEPGMLEKLKNLGAEVFTGTTSDLLAEWIKDVLSSM